MRHFAPRRHEFLTHRLEQGPNWCLRHRISTKTTANARKQNKNQDYGPPPPATSFPPYEPRDFFRFEVIHQSTKSKARVGIIHTPHGIIDTPAFVPVGTNGVLKGIYNDSIDIYIYHSRLVMFRRDAVSTQISFCVGMSQRQADDANVQLMFANSYHLLLQPGPDTIAHMGGLHAFMNRNRPIITDSGGFQVFSLAYGSVHDELSMKGKKEKNGMTKKGNGHRSLSNSVVKISEDGVVFRSYRDGRLISLTPESSVEAQKAYGADIIIPLDELPPYYIAPEDLVGTQ
jgi:queuine tRNA-ribosyltransferase